MTAVSIPAVTRIDPRTGRRILAILAVIAVVALYVAFQGQWTLPHDTKAGIFSWVNEVRDWIDANRTIPIFTFVIDPVRVGIGALVAGFVELLAFLGWPGVLAVAGSFGFVFGGLRLAVLSVGGFASLGVLGPVGPGDGDARADAGRGRHRADHRDPARDHRRAEPPVRGAHLADPRRDADHADVLLPRARWPCCSSSAPRPRRSRR